MGTPFRLKLNNVDYFFSRPEEIIEILPQLENPLDIFYFDLAKIVLNYHTGEINIHSVPVAKGITNSYSLASQPEVIVIFAHLTELITKHILISHLQSFDDKAVNMWINQYKEDLTRKIPMHKLLMKADMLLEKINKKNSLGVESTNLFTPSSINELQHICQMIKEIGIANLKSVNTLEAILGIKPDAIKKLNP